MQITKLKWFIKIYTLFSNIYITFSNELFKHKNKNK